MTSYQPIENYGIIGNMYTTALIGHNGAIDWFCYPNHDSPSVFGAMLDHQKGGNFQISPCLDVVNQKQFYWPETNILVTRFLAECGFAEVIDFMPVGLSADQRGYHWLVRQVRGIRCNMPFRLRCQPAFNYARDAHRVELDDHGARFRSESLNLALVSSLTLETDEKAVWTEFTIHQGEVLTFVLREMADDEASCGLPVEPQEAEQLFEATIHYWRNWLSACVYKGRWREMVERSALVLKLLTFEPTGAIVAAPTTSLPEQVGGQRNWDYRYTWIRDAAFTLYGLLRIGFTEEAAQFMDWIKQRCHELSPEGALQAVYGIHGEHELPEKYLDHLEGYRQSSPVRIGNGAVNQFQVDIYGELMDSVYLFNKYGTPISFDFWQQLERLLDWVCDHWQEPDEGIWETRGGRQQFVYSKLMAWVALDRGLRLAEKRSFPANEERWLQVRNQIYREIMECGWNETRQAFVQHYDSDILDASALIMPLVFFMAPKDPRMLKTLNAIQQPPNQGGLVFSSLVYRYNAEQATDGLDGQEGTFNLCSFWLVEALTRAGRTDPKRLDEARLMFEEMLSYANHLGLYAEETGSSGEALGNFPQAFTHLSLISAAWNLNRAIEGND